MTYEEYTDILNENPPKEHIKVRSGVRYLPISYIEAKMDEVFQHRWGVASIDTTETKEQWITKVIVYYVDPVDGKKHTRAGAASAMITKGKNAMEMCAPHSLADAIKNAVKGIGVVFGRDLNRDHKFQIVQEEILENEQVNSLLNEIESITDKEQFLELRKKYGRLLDDTRIKSYALNKYKSL